MQKEKHGFHPVQGTILRWEHARGRSTSPEIVKESLKHIREKRKQALGQVGKDILNGTGHTLSGIWATGWRLAVISFYSDFSGVLAGGLASAMGASSGDIMSIAKDAAFLTTVFCTILSYTGLSKGLKNTISGPAEMLGAPIRYFDTMHKAHKGARKARRSDSTYPLYY